MIFMMVMKWKQLFWIVTEAVLLTYDNKNLQSICQENWWRDSSEEHSFVSDLNWTKYPFQILKSLRPKPIILGDHVHEEASEENSSGKGKKNEEWRG